MWKYFSDVRFSKELVEDFFSNKDFCSNVKQLVFVGCYLMTHCAKDFVKKMKNVDSIIYYQNDLGEADLKHSEELVNIPTLRYLYYPQADLVNLSKLTSKDQYSPFYFELEDGYSVDDSEDSEDHQVMIFDIEKTKQFQKSKGNLEETLKMFGIISNEFKELYLKAIESPTNQCISQLNKLINNGMHFFDVNFKDCYMDELILNHWRHLHNFPFLTSSYSFRLHLSDKTLKLLKQASDLKW